MTVAGGDPLFPPYGYLGDIGRTPATAESAHDDHESSTAELEASVC